MKSSLTPLAIIIAAFLLVIGAKFIGQPIWIVLTAIGTIGAVIWAIFHQAILTRWRRPILEIMPFEQEPPHLRQVPLRNAQTGELIGVIGYPLSIQLVNTGKTLAKNAQPLITGMGRFEDGKWQIQDNWIPAPIRWGLDIRAEVGTGEPIEEKDLVPYRPYIFNLGILRTDYHDSFLLNPIIMAGNQARDYDPGEFCFVLTVFAEGAEPAKKYIHIQWDGGCTDNLEEVKKKIRISITDHLP